MLVYRVCIGDDDGLGMMMMREKVKFLAAVFGFPFSKILRAHTPIKRIRHHSLSMIDKKFNTQSILQYVYVQLFFYDRLYPPTRSTSSCKMTHAEKAKMANKVQSPPGKAMESIKAFCRVISVDMVILDSNSLADFR